MSGYIRSEAVRARDIERKRKKRALKVYTSEEQLLNALVQFRRHALNKPVSLPKLKCLEKKEETS